MLELLDFPAGCVVMSSPEFLVQDAVRVHADFYNIEANLH